MIKLYNSAAIRDQIAELLDEADALINFAESEERELSAEEKARVDEVVAKVGEPSHGDKPATGLEADFEAAVKFEQLRARQGQIQRPQGAVQQPQGQGGKEKQPAIPRSKCRLRAFRDDKDAYFSGQWFKAQFLKDERAAQFLKDYGVDGCNIQNVQTTLEDPDGGFITPDPMSNAILDAMDIFGATRVLARNIQMSAPTLSIPRRSGGLTVYYPAEAASITASDKSWTQTKLTAAIRATLTKVSLTLQSAAVINVMDDLAMEIGRAFGIQMDKELILGDGTSTYGGVQGLPSASNISTTGAGSTYETCTLANFHSVVGALPQKFHAGASWLMSRQAWAEGPERLVYAQGGNTVAMTQDGEGRGSSMVTGRQLFGYPVVFSDQMPAEASSAVAAYFGDFSYGAVLGEFGNVQIAVSNDRYFEEGNAAIRGMYQYDLVLTDFSSTGAFSRLVLA